MTHNFTLQAQGTGTAVSIQMQPSENQLQDEPQDYLPPQLDRAVSDNDVRHRFALTLLAESPEKWIAPLRSFQFSMLNTLQSAQAYSILAGSDIKCDGYPFTSTTATA